MTRYDELAAEMEWLKKQRREAAKIGNTPMVKRYNLRARAIRCEMEKELKYGPAVAEPQPQ